MTKTGDLTKAMTDLSQGQRTYHARHYPGLVGRGVHPRQACIMSTPERPCKTAGSGGLGGSPEIAYCSNWDDIRKSNKSTCQQYFLQLACKNSPIRDAAGEAAETAVAGGEWIGHLKTRKIYRSVELLVRANKS